MNRMHPQDLRAIVASLIIISDSSNSNQSAVEFADDLLAEVERTAKPDLIAGCQRSHPHEDPCEHHDFKTEIARLNNLNARIGAERDTLRQALAEANEQRIRMIVSAENLKVRYESLKSSIDEYIDQAKTEERERIIDLLEGMGIQNVRATLEPKP